MTHTFVPPRAIISQDFPKIVVPLIREARHSIRVIVFDWRWYPSIGGSSVAGFNAEICKAAKRGVEVRALVNNEEVKARLLAARCKARRLTTKKLLHTKLMIIDNVKVIIGSHNYTQNAFSLNHEASVLCEMEDEFNDFVHYFDTLWGL